ncbi:energy-coupling factor ABC transporter ATP-binding protein [Herbiconiux sp. CPCC 203407]|uniref:Energy-coupling factor ABC transporter ATP-binding protein n=2 Tax=Herbiconiux oxytropis TaxID=2970915 RepID=A0AA41XEN1_9MICO|nr:ABC transporter ATP-binding protein [Herbiconiux oxytropis]MCS5726587.1 energy-coupling factor ABC transporter ATP-binding protein [Herbiconiux oxytropis]
MTAPVLRARGVRIRHDGSERTTPDGVGLEVRPGEVVLVLGPSGSGKSTLVLALNGLVPHAVPATLEGSIVVDGVETASTTVAELSRRVSMVFQDPDAQIVTGTLLDEVCFGPENLLVPVEAVLARAEAALRQVGLWERRHENPDRLSGGGRQRLAIACALALDSAVMVLDEPTANLDPVGIDEVYAVLERLVQTGEHALVLVEHNLDAAIGLVDRVVVIDRDGRPAFDGPTRSVLRDNMEALVGMGVWLPSAMLAGRRLRAAGHPVPELPLTPTELTALLDTLVPPASAVPVGAAAGSTEIDGAVELAPAGNAVSVRGLRVVKGRSEILHGVDLEIERGAFVAIVGTNGAGKTTLLQSIAGVAAPPRGTVEVLGIDPARVDVRRLARTVGFVFQNPEHQFIRGTVADELAHGLELQKTGPAEIERQVGRMLERFGLTAQRDVHPFLLSGGQKRRLSVGTALIAGAPVLALDEPTFGQDRERAAELLDILNGLNAGGTTVLVVTHDLQLVADHASHVLVLDAGRVAAYDRTAAVLASGALEAAGLAPPPLVRAFRAAGDPAWHALTRLADLDAPSASRSPAEEAP